MVGMLRKLALVAFLGGAAAACVSPGPYVCAMDSDCGPGGTCTADGTCSAVGRLSGDECFVGGPLDAARSLCAADVCAELPWCCAASWGPTCVQAAEVRCDVACGGRVAFTRDRLTNADHSQILQDGSLEVYDFAPGAAPGSLVATPVATGVSGPQAYWSMAWADLDRDRAPELFVGTFDGYVSGEHQRVWRPAAPSWELVFDLATVDDTDQVIDAAFGDTNRDGRMDLVVPIYSALKIYTGVETGVRFVESARMLPGPPEPDALVSGLDTGDVDGDGDDDLAYLDYRNPVGRVVINGAEAFTHGPGLTIADTPGDLMFGDADGDRDLDLLACDSAGLLLWRNDAGVFTEAWNYPPGPRVPSSFTVATWIDVDGDGDNDVLMASGDPARLHLIENLGGTLADSSLWDSPIELAGAVTSVAAGDIDGDGDLDVATSGGDNAPSRIWLNDGDRTFTAAWVDSSARRHRRVALTSQPSP